MLKKIKPLISSHIVVLTVLAFGLTLGINHKRMAARTMDFFTNAPVSLAHCANQPTPCSQTVLREARRYYEGMAVLMPASPQACLPLSYIYDQLGVPSKALRYAQEAQARDLVFYGTHYNNSILLWKMRRWKDAAREMELALPELTSQLFPPATLVLGPAPKKIYFDETVPGVTQPPVSRLSAYTDAMLLLTLAYAELKDAEAMERSAIKASTLPTSYRPNFLALQKIASYRKAHHDNHYGQEDIDREQAAFFPQLYCVIPLPKKEAP